MRMGGAVPCFMRTGKVQRVLAVLKIHLIKHMEIALYAGAWTLFAAIGLTLGRPLRDVVHHVRMPDGLCVCHGFMGF
jgi:hypothetical protein